METTKLIFQKYFLNLAALRLCVEKNIYKIFAVLLTFICCGYSVYAKDAGTTSANFLKIGAGARSAALGGSFTAVNNDIYSLYWNPAGISEIKTIEITGMRNNWIADIDYNFIGGVIPLKNFKLGISGILLTMDDIDKTIETIGGYQKIGTFSPKDYELVISAGKKINDNLNLGLSLKYIKSELDNYDADAVAIDAGLIYKTKIENLQFGFAMKNLGTKMKFISKKESLPLNFQVGAEYAVIPENLKLFLDADKYIDNEVKIHSGLEWNVNVLSLRIGYNSLSDIGNGLTAGLGLKYKQIKFDYAFEPQGDFGDSHRFSMTIAFK